MSKEWMWFWAVLLALGSLIGYAVACRVWPFMDCRKCKGRGKFRSPSGKAWRRCRRCKGSGDRIRTGRRFWTWMSGVKKSAVG